MENRDKLIRAWLRELNKEYQRICYTYGVELAIPIIRVAELRSAWGLWQHHPRMITIAWRLITDYPWNTVIEIMKHEMAHQMVTEIHRDDEHHGPEFKRCCRKLGMAAWAMKAEVELGDQVYASETDASDARSNPVVRKVRKLLALSNSSEKHEATLAMQRVKEICARHNLKSVRKEDDEYVMEVVNSKKKRLSHEQLAICGILTSYFPVNVICSSLYDARENTTHRTLELFGRSADVKIAEYVYHYLLNQLDLLWQKESLSLPLNERRAQKGSFNRGVLWGFGQKLGRENSAAQTKVTKSLVVALQDRAVEFSRTRCPRVRHTHVGSARHSHPSYTRGVQAGHKLELRKGMEKSSKPLSLRESSL